MNWDRIEGDWKQFSGKVKQKWGQLTDDDLAKVNGRREQLEGTPSAALWLCEGTKAKTEVDQWANDLK